MWDALFWLYLVNAALLICHEIDSAYWREWELFGLPGGVGFFVLLHVPLVMLLLAGSVWVADRGGAGLVISLAVAAGGVIAFCLHMLFIKRGRPEFKTPVSIGLLTAVWLLSLAQIVVAGTIWLG
jgi:hypothetical protein